MGFGRTLANWTKLAPFTRPSQAYHLPQTTRLEQPPIPWQPNGYADDGTIVAAGPGYAVRPGMDGDPGEGSRRASGDVYGIGPARDDGRVLGISPLALEHYQEGYTYGADADASLDVNRAGRDLSHIFGSQAPEQPGSGNLSRSGDWLQMETQPPMISRRNWANNMGLIGDQVAGWPYDGSGRELPHQDIIVDRAPVVAFVKNVDDNFVIPATYVGEVS